VPEQGWVAAEDLKQGTVVQTENGAIVDVDRVERRDEKVKVYNFEVEGFHTYFVSDLRLLVHNHCNISMDDAIQQAEDFLEPGVPMRFDETGSGVQVIQEFTDNAGRRIVRRVGFDVNPNSGHVQQYGPHVNLQTRINGRVQRGNSPLADPHTPIDPSTIRPGDF
jgi:hypothetical protein